MILTLWTKHSILFFCMVAPQPSPPASTAAAYTQSQARPSATPVPDNGAGERNGGVPSQTPCSSPQTTTLPTPDGQTTSPAQFDNTSGTDFEVGTKYLLHFLSTGRMIYAIWKGSVFDARPEVTPTVTIEGKFNDYGLTHIQHVKEYYANVFRSSVHFHLN